MEIPPSPSDALQRHPASLATRKVRTAQTTLETLDCAWTAHLASGHVTLDVQRDREQHTISFIVRIPDPESLEDLDRLLRSCVSDARSALSNLVHELARRTGATPADLKKSDFPIISTGQKWKGDDDPRLRALPSDCIERIRRVQPFTQHLPQPWLHPLEALRELSNEDKHRYGLQIAPNLDGDGRPQRILQMKFPVSAELVNFTTTAMAEPDQVIDMNPHPLVDGSVALRLHIPEWVDVERDVEIADPNITLGIALMLPTLEPDDYPLLLTLRDALWFVRTAIRYVAGIDDKPPTPRPRLTFASDENV